MEFERWVSKKLKITYENSYETETVQDRKYNSNSLYVLSAGEQEKEHVMCDAHGGVWDPASNSFFNNILSLMKNSKYDAVMIYEL